MLFKCAYYVFTSYGRLTLMIPAIDNVRLEVLDKSKYSDNASIKARQAPNSSNKDVWKITSTSVKPRKSLVDDI